MSYIDCKLHQGKIYAWEFDGTSLQTHVADADDYLYAFVPSTDQRSPFRSIYDKPMRKMRFKDSRRLAEYARKNSGVCESDIRPAYRYLIDNFADSDTSAPFRFLPFDIEVNVDLEAGHGYSSIHDPFEEVIAISCFDYHRMTYVMYIPSEHKGKVTLKPSDGFPLDIFWCSSERDMLMMFASLVKQCDVISAWNGDGYDIPYIIERCIILFGEEKARTMFCRNEVPARKREYTDEYGQDVWTWEFSGIVHVDMQQLYKKFVPGEKPSTKLSVIAEIEELGIEKMEYEGDLGMLYRENPQKFFDYSLRDSELLKAMEDKKQLVKMAMLYARDTCVLPTDATGSVKPIEHGFIKFCRQKGNIVLPDRQDKPSEEFDGAIVYDTLSGRHGYVFTVDLAALYPSCMIMLGISPETLLMQCEGHYEDYISIMRKEEREVTVVTEDTGDTITLPARELESMIREEGFTISANGTIYNGELGLLSEYVKSGFDRRVEEKRIMSEAFKAGDKVKGELYNLFQSVTKIRNNSIYGCVGNEWFRLYDVRNAASITLTGQVISKHQAIKANELLNDLAEAA